MLLYHGSKEIVEYPTHQIGFHTIQALDTLKFVGSEVVYGSEK